MYTFLETLAQHDYCLQDDSMEPTGALSLYYFSSVTPPFSYCSLPYSPH